MAYSTGTSASPTALKATIESFATTNGFTLTGSIIKDTTNLSYKRLTAVDSEYLKIEGATSDDFTTGVSASEAYLYAPSGNWPVTYHLFYIASLPTIYCVIQYDSTKISWLAFGTVTKAGTSYTGGSWFAGQVNRRGDVSFACTELAGASNSTSSAMFFWKDDGTSGGSNSFIHAEIDSLTWINDSNDDSLAYTSYSLYPLLSRQPNVWNNEVTLLPARVFYHRLSDYPKDLGSLNGIRILRTDNYINADIIDLSPDKWMVFSAYEKDVSARDGITSTGTFGFAIYYDGP